MRLTALTDLVCENWTGYPVGNKPKISGGRNYGSDNNGRHAGGNGRRAEGDGHGAEDDGSRAWGELGNPVGNGHNKGSLLFSVNSWTGQPVGYRPKISGDPNKTNWVTLWVIPMEFKIMPEWTLFGVIIL